MGRSSLLRKGDHLHHPEHATASSIERGRHLEPEAIARSKKWCEGKVFELSRKKNLTPKERHLLDRLLH